MIVSLSKGTLLTGWMKNEISVDVHTQTFKLIAPNPSVIEEIKTANPEADVYVCFGIYRHFNAYVFGPSAYFGDNDRDNYDDPAFYFSTLPESEFNYDLEPHGYKLITALEFQKIVHSFLKSYNRLEIHARECHTYNMLPNDFKEILENMNYIKLENLVLINEELKKRLKVLRSPFKEQADSFVCFADVCIQRNAPFEGHERDMMYEKLKELTHDLMADDGDSNRRLGIKLKNLYWKDV